jgi:hypothetical protein
MLRDLRWGSSNPRCISINLYRYYVCIENVVLSKSTYLMDGDLGNIISFYNADQRVDFI